VRTTEVTIETSRGPARATVHCPPGRRAPVLVIALHGAGTDTSRTPLPELCDALAAHGITAIRFDQPYRVAGRRAPDAAHLLDRALLEAAPRLRTLAPRGAAVGLVGRSSGARVACRVAGEVGAAAIACLGFPYQPAARRGGAVPAHRGAELALGVATCPVLVVQGSRDPFGLPPAELGAEVVIEEGAGHVPTATMARRATDWLRATLR
jgi:uncharacterized protein